ncbi:hypothetical protein TNCV_1087891 [Trichonephila clavipes]|uniref:Uncharacterized protein n=1 Tax=Trichonephila clavipes TaxID=2585209 RepID=A0A8X6SNH2_TRICX|nr:hypothetical protein TNCV_1087891 [Trichonephila clavipes]
MQKIDSGPVVCHTAFGFCNVVFGAACKHRILRPAYGNNSSTRGFLPVSIAENEIEGSLFCGFRRGDQKCEKATEGYLKKWIPGMFCVNNYTNTGTSV